MSHSLEGEKSALFRLEQGVAQGCSLSRILFLKEVEEADLGVQLSNGKKFGVMLFAEGVSNSKESLLKLTDVVHRYWRLKANVSKCVVMVFFFKRVEDGWKWGSQ